MASALETMASQVAMLHQECVYIGNLVYKNLERSLAMLATGRAPRALGLSPLLKECEESVLALKESLAELSNLSRNFSQLVETEKTQNLTEQAGHLNQECRYWKAFLLPCQSLIDKINLVAELDQLNPFSRLVIQDIWEEIRRLAAQPS